MKYPLVLLLALAAVAWAEPNPASPPEADRKAILAMTGEFKVDFAFQETDALQAGYALQAPYHEEAHELVFVTEDTGARIALQHLLVTESGRVVKHWKQIWTWQDRELIEFQGGNAWKIRVLSDAEAAGTWSQLVTQVDDSPRYESFGKWGHGNGGELSAWESAPTARPLPRREEKRTDYQILEGINRHVITSQGWEHQQANRKKILPDGILAKETGLNRYDRITDFDFTPARDYWKKTSGFWTDVMAAWDEAIAGAPAFRIHDERDGKMLWKEMFELAKNPDPARKPRIGELIARHLERM